MVRILCTTFSHIRVFENNVLTDLVLRGGGGGGGERERERERGGERRKEEERD